jgi:ABC-type bacteriocin/lantibiotic exporter with double-glycine peptidase domain
LVLRNENEEAMLHFSLVLVDEHGGVRVVDPTVASTAVEISKDQLKAMWTGLAIAVDPGRGGDE